jgi:hypothetical protein
MAPSTTTALLLRPFQFVKTKLLTNRGIGKFIIDLK